MKLKYSAISHSLASLGHDVFDTPRAILEGIKAAGYDGVDLPADVERLDPKIMRPLLADLGLEVPELSGAWSFHHAGEERNLASVDAEPRRRGVEYARQCLDLAAELDAPFFNVCGAQFPTPQIPFPRTSIAILRENFLNSLRVIVEHARGIGVIVLLEPLNRYECCPGVLTTISDALWMIEQLGADHLGIQPDIYHMHIAEISIAQALRSGGRHIKLMHVIETTRFRFGMGHADFPMIFEILNEIGYNGCMSVYSPLISQELSQFKSLALEGRAAPGRLDVREVMQAQLTFLKQIEARVSH